MNNQPNKIPFTIPELEAQAQQEAEEQRELEDALGLEHEEPLGDDPFLDREIAIYPSSSNIYWFKFFPQTGEMLIQYRSGGLPYLYSSNRGEAKSFQTSQSKGKFAAANYRGRGFRRVPSSYSTKWQI